MSETQASQAIPEAKMKRETAYEKVAMTDGRTVEFAGSRMTDKTILTENGLATGVRFDFRNGETNSLMFADLSPQIAAQALGHGIAQKAGDDYAGVKEIDDIVLSVDEMFARLRGGEWGVARAAGDSTSGASIVIKAIMEATSKDIATIKGFLQGKLDKAKAAGEKLSRQELYNSFRNPATKTGAIIDRMEKEKAAKSTKVNAGDLLSELEG